MNKWIPVSEKRVDFIDADRLMNSFVHEITDLYGVEEIEWREEMVMAKARGAIPTGKIICGYNSKGKLVAISTLTRTDLNSTQFFSSYMPLPEPHEKPVTAEDLVEAIDELFALSGHGDLRHIHICDALFIANKWREQNKGEGE